MKGYSKIEIIGKKDEAFEDYIERIYNYPVAVTSRLEYIMVPFSGNTINNVFKGASNFFSGLITYLIAEYEDGRIGAQTEIEYKGLFDSDERAVKDLVELIKEHISLKEGLKSLLEKPKKHLV